MTTPIYSTGTNTDKVILDEMFKEFTETPTPVTLIRPTVKPEWLVSAILFTIVHHLFAALILWAAFAIFAPTLGLPFWGVWLGIVVWRVLIYKRSRMGLAFSNPVKK